jgi:hypothetical protein
VRKKTPMVSRAEPPSRSQGDPVLFLSNPAGIDSELQRDSLDAIRNLNEEHLGAVGDPEIATRINSFELAYRMQTSAPELMDQLTYRFQGRDFRLTDVHGEVVQKLLRG